MASRPRRRMIDPGIWTDPDLGGLSPIHRLFYIGLFSVADDEGRLKATPRQLRAQVFPYDDITVEGVSRLIDDLHGIGLIHHYEVDGQAYIAHPNWLKHQQISPSKRIASDIPAAPPQKNGGFFPPNGGSQPEKCRKNPRSIREDKLREDSPPSFAPPGAQGCANQEEAGGDLGEELGGEGREQRQEPAPSVDQAAITIRFTKPPASDTRANLKNAGFVYDGTTQTWTAPATPRARELAERYRPYLVFDTPQAAAAAAIPPATPRPTRQPESAPLALPPTPAHLQPVLKALGIQLTVKQFMTWFSAGVCSLTGDQPPRTVEVNVISQVAADWIQENYLPQLRDACQQVLGRVPAIKIGVPDATEPARASPPGGPPREPAEEPAAESVAH